MKWVQFCHCLWLLLFTSTTKCKCLQIFINTVIFSGNTLARIFKISRGSILTDCWLSSNSLLRPNSRGGQIPPLVTLEKSLQMFTNISKCLWALNGIRQSYWSLNICVLGFNPLLVWDSLHSTVLSNDLDYDLPSVRPLVG